MDDINNTNNIDNAENTINATNPANPNDSHGGFDNTMYNNLGKYFDPFEFNLNFEKNYVLSGS